MNNKYAATIAPMVGELLPESFRVETLDNWPGTVFIHHSAGYRLAIDLFRVLDGRKVDNRRRPTAEDSRAVVTLAVRDLHRATRDPRLTEKAKGKALAAWGALPAWKEVQKNVATSAGKC